MADAILPQENGIPVDTGELNDYIFTMRTIMQWSMMTARQIEVNGVTVETGFRSNSAFRLAT